MSEGVYLSIGEGYYFSYRGSDGRLHKSEYFDDVLQCKKMLERKQALVREDTKPKEDRAMARGYNKFTPDRMIELSKVIQDVSYDTKEIARKIGIPRYASLSRLLAILSFLTDEGVFEKFPGKGHNGAHRWKRVKPFSPREMYVACSGDRHAAIKRWDEWASSQTETTGVPAPETMEAGQGEVYPDVATTLKAALQNAKQGVEQALFLVDRFNEETKDDVVRGLINQFTKELGE